MGVCCSGPAAKPDQPYGPDSSNRYGKYSGAEAALYEAALENDLPKVIEILRDVPSVRVGHESGFRHPRVRKFTHAHALATLREGRLAAPSKFTMRTCS